MQRRPLTRPPFSLPLLSLMRARTGTPSGGDGGGGAGDPVEGKLYDLASRVLFWSEPEAGTVGRNAVPGGDDVGTTVVGAPSVAEGAGPGGQDVMRFNGSSRIHGGLTGTPFTAITGDFWVAGALKRNASANSGICGNGGDSAGRPGFLAYITSGGGLRLQMRDSLDAAVASTMATYTHTEGAWNTFAYSVDTVAKQCRGWLNGLGDPVAGQSLIDLSALTFPIASVFHVFTVGDTRSSSSAFPLNGDLLLFVGTGTLTDEEVHLLDAFGRTRLFADILERATKKDPVLYVTPGFPTPTVLRASFRTLSPINVQVLDAAGTLVGETGLTTPTGGYVKAEFTGLTASTTYRLQAVTSEGLVSQYEARLTTQPATLAEGATLRLGAASCVGSTVYGAETPLAENERFFGVLARQDLAGFVMLGDWHYGDIGVDDEAPFTVMFDLVGQTYRQRLWRERQGSLYIASDHDYGGADSHVGSNDEAFAAHRSWYRKAFPHPNLPLAGNNYHYHDIADVARVIVPDLRGEWDPTAIAGAGQVMSSAQWSQMQTDILAAAAAGRIIILGLERLISGTSGSYNTDSIASTTFGRTWRQTLCDFLRDNGLLSTTAGAGSVLAVCGDQHAFGYDDGTNNKHDSGGTYCLPVALSAPMSHSFHQTPVGTWSNGTHFESSGAFSRISITPGTDPAVSVQVECLEGSTMTQELTMTLSMVRP